MASQGGLVSGRGLVSDMAGEAAEVEGNRLRRVEVGKKQWEKKEN